MIGRRFRFKTSKLEICSIFFANFSAKREINFPFLPLRLKNLTCWILYTEMHMLIYRRNYSRETRLKIFRIPKSIYCTLRLLNHYHRPSHISCRLFTVQPATSRRCLISLLRVSRLSRETSRSLSTRHFFADRSTRVAQPWRRVSPEYPFEVSPVWIINIMRMALFSPDPESATTVCASPRDGWYKLRHCRDRVRSSPTGVQSLPSGVKAFVRVRRESCLYMHHLERERILRLLFTSFVQRQYY